MRPRASHRRFSALGFTFVLGCMLACPAADQKKSSVAKSESATFRALALKQFDANRNGRLEAKERAAANHALLGKGTDAATLALRKQALAEFDSNSNGKLEKSEIHKALSSVNADTRTAQSNRASSASKQSLDPSERQAARELQREMYVNGITTVPGQIQTLQNLLANNGGTLTSTEIGLIQSLLQQLTTQATTGTSITPTTTIAGTGSTGTGTSSTGTGSGTCSGGSSGTSTGSSTGTSTTSTASSARNTNGQSGATGLSTTGGGIGSGRFGGFGGFRGRR